MSTRKINISTNKIEDFLKASFENVKIISEFSGNENARAFLFASNDKEYVIKLDSHDEDFRKDKYAFEHFSSRELIIPKVFKQGKIENDLYFSISLKIDGNILNSLNLNELNLVFPHLAKVLKKIHDADISQASGYGIWNVADGNAPHQTWKDAILGIDKSSYFNWEKLFMEGIYEKDLFDKAYSQISDLAKFLNEDRSLIHGDFGFNNVLVEAEKVTGVLDWALSRYGDFIYDIAYLAFWDDRLDYGKIFRKNYKDKNIENYDERMLCYMLHIGLTSSGFSAKWGNKKQYDETKQIFIKLLEQ